MEIETGRLPANGLSNSGQGPDRPAPRKQRSHVDVNTPGGMIWLCVCFMGIMASFIAYGIVMEYATSGGRRLHELSLIFVTSLLYSGTAYVGRYVRAEKPTTVAPSRLMVLAVTSMGSTYCSVRSLRYVIYPVQVLAKSCKPIPVMLMGALMGKRYPLKKYFNVAIITAGVAMFMMGKPKEGHAAHSNTTAAGIVLLFVSLCFDGGTGAYEDKLMAKHHVGPFDLMYNMHLGKAILAGIGLIVLGQINYFILMCHETGFLLLLLGVSGAFGQVFIFVTISKFGALTCSIMGLARKVVTLVASIYIYGHSLNGIQALGLVVAFAAMISGFFDKSSGRHPHGGVPGGRVNGSAGPATSLAERERAEERRAEAKPLLAPLEGDRVGKGPEPDGGDGLPSHRPGDGKSLV
jgi:UDP-galactose transporter B1